MTNYTIENKAEKQYGFLLDTNFYNNLKKSNEVLFNFTDSIKKHPVLSNLDFNDNFSSYTPFSIIEYLGIVIPLPSIRLPKQEFQSPKTYLKAFKFVKKEAEEFFLNLEKIQPHKLTEEVKKNKKFSCNHTSKLPDIIHTATFHEHLVNALVFDYVSKFQFPKNLQRSIFHYILLPMVFEKENETSRFNKFRIIKRIWENTYKSLVDETDIPNDFLKELNDSMKLKNKGDNLDCDIIHFSTVGDCINGEYKPVFTFTCDDKETIINRVFVYKSMLQTLIDYFDENEYLLKQKVFNQWEQGMIVFCNSDGKFIEYIDVSNIRTIQQVEFNSTNSFEIV